MQKYFHFFSIFVQTLMPLKVIKQHKTHKLQKMWEKIEKITVFKVLQWWRHQLTSLLPYRLINLRNTNYFENNKINVITPSHESKTNKSNNWKLMTAETQCYLTQTFVVTVGKHFQNDSLTLGVSGGCFILPVPYSFIL